MENENRELLDEVIKKTLEDISYMKTGAKERADAIEELREIYRLKIEDDKNNWEYNDRAEKRAAEEKAQKKDRRIKVGLEITSIFAPIIAYGTLFAKGLKFEETGAIASSMMKNLLSKIKFTKR